MTILGSTTKFVVKLCPKCNYVRLKKIQGGHKFYLRIKKNHNLKKLYIIIFFLDQNGLVQ